MGFGSDMLLTGNLFTHIWKQPWQGRNMALFIHTVFIWNVNEIFHITQHVLTINTGHTLVGDVFSHSISILLEVLLGRK